MLVAGVLRLVFAVVAPDVTVAFSLPAGFGDLFGEPVVELFSDDEAVLFLPVRADLVRPAGARLVAEGAIVAWPLQSPTGVRAVRAAEVRGVWGLRAVVPA